MSQEGITELVEEIMMDFARSTGLSPPTIHPRRYLWTDAFAVCNFLELSDLTKDDKFKHLAIHLVDQVHHVLGRHREDDPRKGWISGLEEEEGEEHPTVGGLRIGKPLKERREDDIIDPRLEWDQDGQYYHYLTKWMHALNRAGKATGDPKFIRWAVELAKGVHPKFTYSAPGGRKRMYWKMSIDLSRPLVPSMGQHDPLDGFVTNSELRSSAKEFCVRCDLDGEVKEMASILQGMSLVTDDPLGIGGLLFDATRMAQMNSTGDLSGLMMAVIRSSLVGLESFSQNASLGLSAEYRLAFRELGLSIGLKGTGLIERYTKENADFIRGEDSLKERISSLKRYSSLGREIDRFWTDRTHWGGITWQEHRDINMVMLATSLSPNEFLSI